MNEPTLSLRYRGGGLHSVVMLLGGNQGPRARLLREAFLLLTREVGCCKGASSFYESEAWGFSTDAPPFLNRVLFLETLLSPQEAMEKALSIEERLGRVRLGDAASSFASRTVDIDILFYDHLVVSTPSLVIPHPRMASRKFVLVPLAELIPAETHPVLGITVKQLLEQCNDVMWVRHYKESREAI